MSDDNHTDANETPVVAAAISTDSFAPVLALTAGNRSKAGRLLNCNRKTVARHFEYYPELW